MVWKPRASNRVETPPRRLLADTCAAVDAAARRAVCRRSRGSRARGRSGTLDGHRCETSSQTVVACVSRGAVSHLIVEKPDLARGGGGRLYPLAALAALARIDAQGDSSRASHPTDMLDINLFRTDKGGDPVRAPRDARSPRDRSASLGRTSSNPPLADGGRRFRVASRPLRHPPRASCDSTHLAPPIV